MNGNLHGPQLGLLTLTTKRRRRVTTIVWSFSVRPSVRTLVYPPEAGVVNQVLNTWVHTPHLLRTSSGTS